MRFLAMTPEGWPVSLWFFVATAVVYLLQRFPLTGIFLMIALAAFWSVILVNLGFIGVAIEALTGRVSRAWLILPLLYFGLYYLAYYKDQATLASLRSQYAAHNQGKSLPFDQQRQDLLFEPGKGDFHPLPFEFVRRFGVRRTFESNGRMHFIGDREACAYLRDNDVLRSARIYATGFYGAGGVGTRAMVKDYCSITGPGAPEKPVVRVSSDDRAETQLLLPVQRQELRIRDDASGREVELWSGSVGTLKAFPMPMMGCFLNSGAASWDCSAGFLRDRQSILSPGERYGDSAAMVAEALGLKSSDDYAAVATGPERLRAVGEAADQALIAKEMAILHQMLAEPTKHVQDGWFYHLPNRAEVVEPHASRIFTALEVLQRSDISGSENGRNLWRLAAALPEEALARHRPEMVEWLRPENARPWTGQTGDIFARLNGSDPAEREILLHRLENKRGDLEAKLLPSFCRMGASAPDDVKRRLLALWHQRGEATGRNNGERPSDHVSLYFTLARMGLKGEAGKVEQRYYGPTFAAIWEEVTPDFPDDL